MMYGSGDLTRGGTSLNGNYLMFNLLWMS